MTQLEVKKVKEGEGRVGKPASLVRYVNNLHVKNLKFPHTFNSVDFVASIA